MGSPEVIRPQEDLPPEVVRSGALKSQLGKFGGTSETRIPEGKEWARILIQKIPDTYKKIVTDFIVALPYENRQAAAQNLSGLIDGMGDQIWRSRYPEVEIQRCIEETQRWLLNDRKEAA